MAEVSSPRKIWPGIRPLTSWWRRGCRLIDVLAPTARSGGAAARGGFAPSGSVSLPFHGSIPEKGEAEIRLIDAARVRPLPGALTRRRWIVKDLAQFWYSTLAMNVSDLQRDEWLRRYCGESQTGDMESIWKIDPAQIRGDRNA